MRRKFTFIFLILTSFILTGCKLSKDPIIVKTDSKESLSDFKFKVENITLSSGYQNLTPNVTVSKDEKNLQLVASCGLIESAGIEVENIERLNDEVNIYVKNISNDSLNKFVVPQALIKIEGINRLDIENLNFNIINTNYENVSVGININDILNKIETTYKLTSSSYPKIELIKSNDNKNDLVWDIEYERVFNDNFEKSPIINLHVNVDANTGHLTEVDSESTSTYIDHGLVLDKTNPQYIIYKKSENNNDNVKDTLWLFDTKTDEINNIHIASLPIVAAKLSPDSNYISILEKNDDTNIVYILEKNSKKSYKVMLNNENNRISSIGWTDDNKLLIVENIKNKSIIHKYNVITNEFENDINSNVNISSICSNNNRYATTFNNKKTNETVINILDNDFNTKSTFEGYKPIFLNSNKLGYLNVNVESNNNEFFIVNLEDNTIYDKIDLNVTNFMPIDDNNLILIINNGKSSEYTTFTYKINEKELEEKNKTLTDNIWYNSNDKLVYSNYRLLNNSGKSDSNIIFYLNDFNLFD